MISDKIFISTLNDGDNHYSITPTDNVANKKYEVAYIRKNALLEWAKEKAEVYKGTANIRRSFELMIKKIESL